MFKKTNDLFVGYATTATGGYTPALAGFRNFEEMRGMDCGTGRCAIEFLLLNKESIPV